MTNEGDTQSNQSEWGSEMSHGDFKHCIILENGRRRWVRVRVRMTELYTGNVLYL